MSLFGTFRRTKAKKQSIDELPATQGSSPGGSIKASGVFNSTPNLHRIDPIVHKTASKYTDGKTEISGSVHSNKWNFESRRSSSSTETWTGGSGGGVAIPNWEIKSRSGGKTPSDESSLRRFASMMSFMGSLKKSRSTRKLAFGSTAVSIVG
jgi:hypothetical protein